MIKKKILFCFLFFSSIFLYANEIVHIVKKGETVYSLSRRYGVSVSSILTRNNIKDATKIKTGQKIFISTNSETNGDSNNSTNKNHKPDITTYQVIKGDSLFRIAKKFNVKISDLQTLNNLNENSIIKIGQILKIPKTEKLTDNSKKQDNIKNNSDKIEKSKTEKKEPVKQTVNTKQIWPVPATSINHMSGKVPGIVIDSKKGQEVKAVHSGRVVSVGNHRGFGQVVFVQSKTKHIYVYGGMESVNVKKGDKISLNDTLGVLGVELFTNKARCYFIVYHNNTPINPEKAPRGI